MNSSCKSHSDEKEWVTHAGAYGWSSLSSPQVQVQALANSSPRLRHAFVRNMPSYSPTPYPTSEELTKREEDVRLTRRGQVTKNSLPRTIFVSPVTWCLAQVDWSSQLSWLSLYFAFNLFLTLSNKSVLTGFPFPYTLTAIHALCSTIGGILLRSRGSYVSKRLDLRGELVLVAFSFLYSINIAVSNVSLHLVTVPFHQVVRAVTPLFTVAISAILFDTRISGDRVHALIPVIFGVTLATYGDYYFTASGFLLTLLGTLLAALKTIYTSVLQSRSKNTRPTPPTPKIPEPATWRATTSRDYFPRARSASSFVINLRRLLVPPSLDLHPLDLLTRMSPLAFVQCVIYAQMSGELDRLSRFGVAGSFPPSQDAMRSSNFHNVTYNSTDTLDCTHALRIGGIPFAQAAVLLLNGCIAFGLNVVSFSANGKVGALSMTVAANIKQVLTILFSVSLFNLTITTTNALGITVTLIGGAWYAWVEYRSKLNRNKPH